MLGWLFKSRVPPFEETKAEQLLKNLRDARHLEHVLDSHVESPSMGFSKAVSCLVMAASDHSTLDMRKSVIDIRKTTNLAVPSLQTIYDRTLIETCAFTHFLAMRRFLFMGHEDESDGGNAGDIEMHSDGTSRVTLEDGLRDAARCSQAVLEPLFSPKLPEQFVLKRMMFYAMAKVGAQAIRNLAGRYERLLVGSIMASELTLKLPAETTGGLDIETSAKSVSAIHCKWWIENLEPVVNGLAERCGVAERL